MRLEHIPLILGVLIGILGVALVADAWIPDDTLVSQERRRRRRAERQRTGEALVGIGTICLAAALIGRDTWRYGTLAVLVGTILLFAGVILNWRFLREVLFFRGPARRAREGEAAPLAGSQERVVPQHAERDTGVDPHAVDPTTVPRPRTGGRETTPPPRPRIR